MQEQKKKGGAKKNEGEKIMQEQKRMKEKR